MSTMIHDISVAGYLSRCKEHRAKGTWQSLLYAALELRMGIETRLAEVVQQIDGLSRAQKRQWSVSDLGRTVEKSFQSGDKMMVLVYHFEDPEETLELHYFPVSSELQTIAGRLGAFLHRNTRIESNFKAVFEELKALLHAGFGLLEMSDAGDLLGMPQRDPTTGRLNILIRLPEGDPRRNILDSGRRYRVDIFEINPVGPITYYEPDDGPEDARGDPVPE